MQKPSSGLAVGSASFLMFKQRCLFYLLYCSQNRIYFKLNCLVVWKMDHRLSLKNTRQYALSFQLTIYNFYMKSKSTIYLCPDWHENFDKTKILKSQYAQVYN